MTEQPDAGEPRGPDETEATTPAPDSANEAESALSTPPTPEPTAAHETPEPTPATPDPDAPPLPTPSTPDPDAPSVADEPAAAPPDVPEVPEATEATDPAPKPTPPVPTAIPKPRPIPAPEPTAASRSDAAKFGRVDDDGTVFVKTGDGERVVGQWPDGDPGSRARVLPQAVRRSGRRGRPARAADQGGRAVARGRRRPTVAKVKESVVEAQAVGDLDSLVARLDALAPVIEERREARKAERAAKAAEAKQAKAADRRRGRAARQGQRLAQRR